MPADQVGLLELIITQLPSFITLVVLLILSGFIGGSETALFSLTHFDRAEMRNTVPRIARIADKLLDRSEQVLLTIMLANMAANSLIFTISSLLVYHFVKHHHTVFASAIGLVTVLSLVLGSEILAKSWIYYLRIPVTTLIAGPAWVLMRVFGPVLSLVERFFIVPMVRLLVGSTREHALSKDELLVLFKNSQDEGYLQPAQAELLEKAVELRDLRVRQIMVPRVNMVSCDIHQPTEAVIKMIRQTHRSRIPIYVYQVDYIVGMVRSRRLLVEQPKLLRDILEPVKFVPETQRVDQLLDFFNKQKTDIAMVVDEYRGLSGMVSLEALMERTIGEMPSEFPEPDMPKMVRVSAGEYLVDGDLPLDEFFEQINRPAPNVDVDTVAGLVMHLAGHLPNQGETLKYDEDMEFIALKVDNNWIEKIHVLNKRVNTQ